MSDNLQTVWKNNRYIFLWIFYFSLKLREKRVKGNLSNHIWAFKIILEIKKINGPLQKWKSIYKLIKSID